MESQELLWKMKLITHGFPKIPTEEWQGEDNNPIQTFYAHNQMLINRSKLKSKPY